MQVRIRGHYGPEYLRRHGSHCPGGRALHDMTYEAEFPRAWKKCSCPVYAFGALNGQFKRKNTERTSWSDAKAVVAEWETAPSWGASARPPEPLPVSAVPKDP
jgi:hypothetical protein